jgi:hypothetical protein
VSIREQLTKAQLAAAGFVFLAWLAGFLAMLTQRPQLALVVSCIGFVGILATFPYFYSASRCPACRKSLWLHASKIAPFWPFKPKLDHCPYCKVPAL